MNVHVGGITLAHLPDGDYGLYAERAVPGVVHRISEFTVPAGTTFAAPWGACAPDEPSRVAYNEHGVFPVIEASFAAIYVAQ